MPAWSARRIHSRAAGLQVTRWYSVLTPSIVVADRANTAAGRTRELGVNAMKTAPTTHEATKATRCNMPRRRGLSVSSTVCIVHPCERQLGVREPVAFRVGRPRDDVDAAGQHVRG